MSKMKIREAKLVPKHINLRVIENKICIEYSVKDTISGKILTTAYIHFTPSKELMATFEKEIELAIKTYVK